MITTDFSTSFLVDQTPHAVFEAVTNVRGWWSEEIEGHTEKTSDVFYYHFEDVHRCTIELTEVIPDQKVVWLVKENYFKFTADQTEWTSTSIIFEITEEAGRTRLRFTHEGLVPEYECFEICSTAWTRYIHESLKDLITTGKGSPNAAGKPTTEHEQRLIDKTLKIKEESYSAVLTFDATPQTVYNAINDVEKWWSDVLDGNYHNVGDEFTVHFDDIHVSTQRVFELVPGKKVVWQVTDSKLGSFQNQQEWTGTTIIFDIVENAGKTEIHFRHLGLVPDFQCFDSCSKGWDYYFKGSLYKYVTEGKGTPGL